MLFNKVSGGGSKIKINGKPPTEKMDLVEVLGAIKSNATVPNESFEVLAYDGTNYYIATGNLTKKRYIYKGHPYKNWTLIATLPDFSTNGIYYCDVKIESNGDLNLLMFDDGGDYRQGIIRYKVSNGKVTETLNKNVEPQIKERLDSNTIFELNGKVYIIARPYSTEMGFFNSDFSSITWISDNLQGEYKSSYYNLKDSSSTKGFTHNNKRYGIFTNGLVIAFNPLSNSIDKVVDLNRQGYEFNYAMQTAQSNSENYYVISKKQYKYSHGSYRDMNAFDFYKFSAKEEKLELIQTIESPYNISDKRFFTRDTKDKSYKCITKADWTDDKTKGMIEFPVKTLIDRSEVEV